jgi:two-component system LytT family response regulator
VIRTLVVDDEPLAREGLRALLAEEPDIELAGEAVDGPTAVRAIRALSPDLVFLDIQMPGCDGFDVVEQVAADHLPTFVFVTAYEHYALRAFEAHALDYLLKPVNAVRFRDALQRARLELAKEEPLGTQQRLADLLDARQAGMEAAARGHAANDRTYLVRFPVKEQHRFVLLRAQDLDWIESAGNYVKLHAAGRTFMLRFTMLELERRLDPQRFARIHRSTIVNLDRIKEILPDWHGDFSVVLRDGTSLRLGRSYRDGLLR